MPLTLDVPAPDSTAATPAGDTSFGLILFAPVADSTTAAPAAAAITAPVATTAALAPVQVRLYVESGAGSYATLANTSEVSWRDEISQNGTGAIRIPVADAGSISRRMVLKFYWQGAERFGIRIVENSCRSAVDDAKMLDVTGPGVLALLGDAVIYPEYGIARASGTERRFGYMSKQGSWYTRDPWATPPVVTPFTTYVRYPVYPADLVNIDPAASWLSVLGVTTYSWFRKEWTSATAIPQARLFACSDDDSEWYLDGEPVLQITGDATVLNSMYQADFPIPAGPHVLACRVTDRLKWPGENAMGEIICTIREVPDQASVTASGAPVYGPVVVRSDSSWKALTDLQGHAAWHRSEILLQLRTEAIARGVLASSAVGVDFTAAVDSGGNAWTDYIDFTAPIGTPLDEIATQLSESEMDCQVAAATMTLQAWKRKGTNRTATVALTLAGNLADYQTTETANVVTVLVGQLADGTWLETSDANGVSAWGRVERGVAFGSTADKVTGGAFAAGVLANTANISTIAVEAKPGLLAGAIGYVDYVLGDTITVPGHQGSGTMPARVLALNVGPDGENMACWPELVQDLT